ncbi:ABC transporter substrate-binding protein [Pseudomonas sp. MYb185]|uniref:ABC transporter substrate-binding protein n=1 Tax=Pseudomonas sp. MYb185 TaxID=1848729 RepID=UPI001304E674|nr:ABC transporter substrate-binding protein [Pseudomonas sp. MYb185]
MSIGKVIPRRLVLALLLVIAPQLALAEPPRTIRFAVSSAGVGNPPRIQTGALAIAQAHRYLEQEFEKDGIEIEWVFFKGQGPAVNEAFSSGSVDFATQGGLPSIVGRSVGLKTRAIMVTGGRSNTFLAVRPDSEIASIADLKGRRVAFHKGTATHLAVNRILENNGLAERDLRIVNLEPQTALAAFQSDDLDGLFGGLTLFRLRDLGLARVVYTSKGDVDAMQQSHVLVHEPFAEQYPDIVQRVVKAIVRAAHWGSLEENRDEVIGLWAIGSVTEQVVREDLDDEPLSLRLTPLFDELAVVSDQQSIDDSVRYRLIRRGFLLDDWKDDRFLDAALKELGLEDFWPTHDAKGNLITGVASNP